MKTYRITEKDIQGLKSLAIGYKVFKNDWTAKRGNYDYKDENGNVVGTIHKVDGEIQDCRWGLHFSRKPQNCFNFYECVQWNKFAKVEAYEKIIEADKKTVAQVLKIVETYTFDEFVKLIQEDLQGNNIRGGNDIWGALQCEGISRSIFCYNKSGKLMIFNKKTTEERFNEVINRLYGFWWYPKFNNIEELKGNLAWYETNIPAIVRVPNEVAWDFMPKEMKEYIQSLPEYNDKLFKKITGKIK